MSCRGMNKCLHHTRIRKIELGESGREKSGAVREAIAQIIIAIDILHPPISQCTANRKEKRTEKIKATYHNRTGERRRREHIRRMRKQLPCTQRPLILLKRRNDPGIEIWPGEIYVLQRVLIWPSQVPVPQMRESFRLIGIDTMTTKHNRVIFRFVVSEVS
jgi:hypothetical protein